MRTGLTHDSEDQIARGAGDHEGRPADLDRVLDPASKGADNRIEWVVWNLGTREDFVGPNWLSLNRYDLVAKAYANADVSAPEDADIIWIPMLQALLVERFQIKYHMEDQPMHAYNIHAANPKMTKHRRKIDMESGGSHGLRV